MKYKRNQQKTSRGGCGNNKGILTRTKIGGKEEHERDGPRGCMGASQKRYDARGKNGKTVYQPRD